MAAKAKLGPQVGIIMGSTSDWKTMEAAAMVLKDFDVRFETNVVSAHRTPHWLAEYAGKALGRGLQVIIAGAGGAAHLPGMAAAFTTLPVLGVPVESRALKGLDSLLSIAQMPAGIPVGTLAIGEPGAKNAALLAVSILALKDDDVRHQWEYVRAKQTATVLKAKLPKLSK
jgi:5-(carboxyamino)imidazole ribonucleotide mutase